MIFFSVRYLPVMLVLGLVLALRTISLVLGLGLETSGLGLETFGLGLGLETSGLGLETFGLGLGLETSGLGLEGVGLVNKLNS